MRQKLTEFKIIKDIYGNFVFPALKEFDQEEEAGLRCLLRIIEDIFGQSNYSVDRFIMIELFIMALGSFAAKNYKITVIFHSSSIGC